MQDVKHIYKTIGGKMDGPHWPQMLKKAVIQGPICFLRIKSARRMTDDKRGEEQCLFRWRNTTDRCGNAANHSAARAELKGIREAKSAYRGRTENCCRCVRGYSKSPTTDLPTPTATLHPPTSLQKRVCRTSWRGPSPRYLTRPYPE